jgi:hypothetical protein
MTKFLVTKDTGLLTVEADEANLVGSGMLVFFDDVPPNGQKLVAAFVAGSWRACEKLLDGRQLSN